MICGLLGRKLSHSYSPQIHKNLGKYEYNLYEIEPEELDRFFKTQHFDCLNVTIPYKKDVLPYCTKLSPEASKLGAVNTIIRLPDGTFSGHNTDYFGFQSTIEKTGLCVNGKKVLVLGTGGASNTASVVLQELGADVVKISRTGPNNYNNLNLHSNASIIVNTTPVGMYPNNGEKPLDLCLFPNLEGVIDMIYNPAKTALLQQAEQLQIVAENGLWMLVAQAKESAEWFIGQKIPFDVIPKIHRELKNKMNNIILVGMPGSGKSTIGKLLAEKTGKIFADSDALIEHTANLSIPKIFEQYGEDHFRVLESEALASLGKRSGYVIATGGGCVTKKVNYPYLHQNGCIIWLQRDIDSLSTENRPLSKPGALNEMYKLRKPLYEDFSDFSIENKKTPEDTVDQIVTLLQLED